MNISLIPTLRIALHSFETFEDFTLQYISKFFFQILETTPAVGIMNEYV